MQVPFLHKEMYIASTIAGAIATTVANTFINYTQNEILGISLSLWFIVGVINIYDIHTGIKADTKRRERIGEKFVFESGKGWRAIEKVFVFSFTIFFIYEFEKEVVKNDFPTIFSTFLMYLKFGMFFYLMLVELQSIGENDECRYGKKAKFFILLDNIINTVNKGILSKIKSFFNDNTEPNV